MVMVFVRGVPKLSQNHQKYSNIPAMRKLLSIILLCCLLVFLTGCRPLTALRNALQFGEVEDFDYGVSALQWLPEIQQRAKVWRADAYLFAISESEVDANGNSHRWTYLFFSFGSGKTMQYVYNSGFISQRETVLSPLNPVINLRVDTPTALFRANEAARSFVSNNPINTRVISLIGPPYNSRTQTGSRWQITFSSDTGRHRVELDAATGAVIN